MSTGLQKISEQLRALSKEGPNTALAVLQNMRKAASDSSLFCLALCVPFLQPLPLWGLSTPLGIWLSYLGYCTIHPPARHHPTHREASRTILEWFLRPLSRLQLQPNQIDKTADIFMSFDRNLNFYLKPKHSAVGDCSRSPLRFITGFLIIASGLLLAAPLPFPFSNTFPAWLIVASSLVNLYPSARTWTLCALVAIANVVFWTGLTIGTLHGSSWLLDRLQTL